jgi:hypothetical protein
MSRRPDRRRSPASFKGGSGFRLALSRRLDRPRLLLLGLTITVGLTVVVAVLVAGGGGSSPFRLVPRGGLSGRDPLAFTAARAAKFEQAAAFGLSHALYAKSPGGAVATAKRVERFRALIETAAAGGPVPADMLEALVFLESAGRPEVIAGDDPAGAAGLTQILAETGRDLLGMPVDLAASRTLTRAIDAALARGNSRRAALLRARRRRVDTRFDPRQALAGAVRYLSLAKAHFGRSDLAVVSYHMGMGNLEQVLRAYVGGSNAAPIATLVRQHHLSWVEVYFNSSPIRHAAAWRLLNQFSDDSQTYYWRILAALQIIQLYRNQRPTLIHLARLHDHRPSADWVLHPPGSSTSFSSPSDLKQAWAKGLIQPLPDQPHRLHFQVSTSIGSFAGRVGAQPSLYKGLRPEALALLFYLADRVQQLSRAPTPLVVASAVSDVSYQRLLTTASDNSADLLETTGYSYSIRRRYSTGAQAKAFQYELDRLQALGLIAWTRTQTTIEITVASQAQTLIPAMLKRAP